VDWQKMCNNLGSYLAYIETCHCLDIRDAKNLPPSTKLVVTCDGHPLEFVIVDNAVCKVLVQDGRRFRQPAEGKLLGTITNLKTEMAEADVFIPGERVLLEGHLKRGGLLTYEVGGKKYYADGIDEVEIILPSGTRFNLWSD
jgi:hypothetical protein